MDTAARRFSPEARLRYARTLVWPVAPLAATAWWVVGALPWIVDALGASSPRYWVADAVTGEASGGYVTLLPFRTVFLPLLLAMTLVGGAAAGLCVRWVRRDAGRRVLPAAAAVLGALAATAYSVVQSAGATRQLGSDFDRDDRVLVGIAAVAVAGSLLGVGLGAVMALARPGVAALAAAPVAVAAGAWTTRLVVVALGAQDAGSVVQWTAPATVGLVAGVALARVGGTSRRRVAGWAGVVVAVAVTQAASAAFEHLAGGLRAGVGLPGTLGGLAADARGVFVTTLLPTHLSWWWLPVALGVALGVAPLRSPVPVAPVLTGTAGGLDGVTGATGTTGASPGRVPVDSTTR